MTSPAELDQWRQLAEAEVEALPTTLVHYKKPPHQRFCLKYVCAPLACSPCILFSGLFRLLCCIPTCGESIGGSCCKVYVTESSDKCVTAPCTVADEAVARPKHLSQCLSEPGAKELVWTVFDKLISKMEASTNHGDRYRMMDWLIREAGNFGLFIASAAATPQNARVLFSAALGAHIQQQ